jgi:hypothetical protein
MALMAGTVAAAPGQPDLEAWLWANVKHLPGVTSFCYTAQPMPLVPWTVTYSCQVDSRAKTKQLAWQRAEQARQIIWGLATEPWPDGVVCYVQVTEGPFWLPDQDDQPRYVLRADIGAHPNRSEQPPGPGAEAAAARTVGRKHRR